MSVGGGPGVEVAFVGEPGQGRELHRDSRYRTASRTGRRDTSRQTDKSRESGVDTRLKIWVGWTQSWDPTFLQGFESGVTKSGFGVADGVGN